MATLSQESEFTRKLRSINFDNLDIFRTPDITEENLSLEKDINITAHAYTISDADMVSALLSLGSSKEAIDTSLDVQKSVLLSAFATIKDSSGNPYIKTWGPPTDDVTRFLTEAKTRHFKDDEASFCKLSMSFHDPKESQAIDRGVSNTLPASSDSRCRRSRRFLSSLMYLLFESARYATKNRDEKAQTDLQKRIQKGMEYAIPVGSHLGEENVFKFIKNMSHFFYPRSQGMRAFVYIYCRAYHEDNLELLKRLEAAAGFSCIHYKHTAVRYLSQVCQLSGIPANTLVKHLQSDLFEKDLAYLKTYSEWCETPTQKKDRLFRKMALLIVKNQGSLLSTRKCINLCDFLQFVLSHFYGVRFASKMTCSDIVDRFYKELWKLICEEDTKFLTG